MGAHCVRCGKPAARSERTVDGKRYEIYTCSTPGHGEASRSEIEMPEDPADLPEAAELGTEDDGGQELGAPSAADLDATAAERQAKVDTGTQDGH